MTIIKQKERIEQLKEQERVIIKQGGRAKIDECVQTDCQQPKNL